MRDGKHVGRSAKLEVYIPESCFLGDPWVMTAGDSEKLFVVLESTFAKLINLLVRLVTSPILELFSCSTSSITGE